MQEMGDTCCFRVMLDGCFCDREPAKQSTWWRICGKQWAWNRYIELCKRSMEHSQSIEQPEVRIGGLLKSPVRDVVFQFGPSLPATNYRLVVPGQCNRYEQSQFGETLPHLLNS